MMKDKTRALVGLLRSKHRMLLRWAEKIWLIAEYPFYRLRGRSLPLNTYVMLRTPNWYHDFEILGVKTRQFVLDGYDTSQQDKQKIIFNLLDKAIGYCQGMRKAGGQLRLVELFCADCFYSIYALQNGANSAVGIDLAEESGEGAIRGAVLDQALLVAGLLGQEDKLTVLRQDVRAFQGEYDLCICAGGLYHLEDPAQLIRHISARISRALVIQTVVSLENDSEEAYFESPAPGWTWGCRFNDIYLINLLKENGWSVQSIEQNELRTNLKASDRGSLNIFCTRLD
jgi:hypothetical protein